MKFIKFLNYPYPFYENTKQGLGICVGIGIFIASFCYFFRPFGMDKISPYALLGYGLLSFIVCSFYIVLLPLIFKSTLRTEGWKIYKELLWIMTIVMSLSIANYFYSGLFFGQPSDPIGMFLFVIFYTTLIALIPAIAIILYKQLFVYKKIISDTQKIESKLSMQHLVHQKLETNNALIHIASENKNDELKINKNDFCFLSSSGNYVEIHYTEDAEFQKKLIRNNISKIEDQLKKHERLIRCHRSHIINLDKIKHVNGNLQGYQLHFAHFDGTIPVSRRYTKAIKAAFF